MRGIGGPLLSIGDLLSDVGEENVTASDNSHLTSSSSIQASDNSPHSLDLTKLFQLCAALETANKLVQSTNMNVTLLSEKVRELEKVVKQEDSATAAAKAINISLNQKKDHLLVVNI